MSGTPIRRAVVALGVALAVAVVGIGVVQRGPGATRVAATPMESAAGNPLASATPPSEGADGEGAASPRPAVSGGPSSSPSTEPSAVASGSGPGGTATPEAASTEAEGAIADGTPDDAGDGSIESVDWWTVIEELDARRGAALAATDVEALDGYLMAGSSAWQADAALITDLQERAVRPVGLRTQLVAIEDVAAAATAVEVVLVDQRSAYTLEDAKGQAVQTIDASGSRRWRMTLERSDHSPPDPGWRVAAVQPVAE